MDTHQGTSAPTPSGRDHSAGPQVPALSVVLRAHRAARKAPTNMPNLSADLTGRPPDWLLAHLVLALLCGHITRALIPA
jgi:hypothetical protein